MSISRTLGAEKPATKRPRSYMEGPKDPVAEKQAEKVEDNVYGRMLPVAASQKNRGGGGGRARAPPLLAGGCPLRVRDSIYLSIYIFLSIPL